MSRSRRRSPPDITSLGRWWNLRVAGAPVAWFVEARAIRRKLSGDPRVKAHARAHLAAADQVSTKRLPRRAGLHTRGSVGHDFKNRSQARAVAENLSVRGRRSAKGA